MTDILVLSDLWLPFPGGAERLAFNLARSLQQTDGITVRVLSGYPDALAYDGPPVVGTSIGIGPTHAEGWAVIEEALTEARPDVILTHHLYAYEFAAELQATGIPVVQVVLNNARLPWAAFAVHITDFVRSLAGGWWAEDMTIRPPAFADCVAAVHGDSLGFIKPIPHKGVELIYELAATMPERAFVILRGEWQDLEVIRRYPNVRFVEPVADIRDFYAQCRVLLVPSLSEDAGTVAQEATLNGLPCISSDVGGLLETNGGGLLAQPGNAAHWRAAIRALDDPSFYATVVGSQQRYYESLGVPAALAEFARRIAALG